MATGKTLAELDIHIFQEREFGELGPVWYVKAVDRQLAGICWIGVWQAARGERAQFRF
ncbi:hypothetical protein ACFLWA_12600 [Chloroflexota bacterium]